MIKKLNSIIAKHYKTTAFMLGCISVQTLPPFYHWYLLFPVFTSLLLLLNNTKTPKQAFNLGWLFGFGFFSCGLSWINNALLINPSETGWLIPITFVASGAFLGLFIGIPTLCCYFFKSLYSRFLSLASLIVIFEWIRSWIFTGFPWNLWGTTLTFNLPLSQTASVFGTYGLSLLVILISSSPALFFYYKNKKSIIICIISIIITPIILYTWGNLRIKSLQDDSNSSIKARIVQPSIPQSVKWSPNLQQEHFQKYIDMSAQSLTNDTTLTIWGETASPYLLDMDTKAKQLALQAIGDKGYLITGQVRYQDNYYGGYIPLNSALVISKNGNIDASYDKSHLVPFGEYIPFRQFLPNFIKPIANTISDFKAGRGPEIISLPNIPPFGIQICYEIIFPHQIINPQNKPQWLINLTNDGWYGVSSGPYQHMVSTQLRAIEEGITIIRSANSGISGIINRYGKIISSLPLHQENILDIYLPKKLEVKTIYNSYGNITIIIICLINLIISLYISYRTKIR